MVFMTTGKIKVEVFKYDWNSDEMGKAAKDEKEITFFILNFDYLN